MSGGAHADDPIGAAVDDERGHFDARQDVVVVEHTIEHGGSRSRRHHHRAAIHSLPGRALKAMGEQSGERAGAIETLLYIRRQYVAEERSPPAARAKSLAANPDII